MISYVEQTAYSAAMLWAVYRDGRQSYRNLAHPQARFMMHQPVKHDPKFGLITTRTKSQASDVRRVVVGLRGDFAKLCFALESFSQKTWRWWMRTLLDGKEHYFSAQELLGWGLLDEIREEKPSL